ncbi:DsbA family protein [Phenylobacterium sp.]|uniref:DsbA family protein n=1 Tax=Phenylobacterium sp. TaxID=1871053 RepID=UPI00286AD776|nr:DsbA family protein [Phenylobacterium sp.]
MTSGERAPGQASIAARRPRLTLALAAVVGLTASFGLQQLPRTGVKLRLTPVVQAVLNDPGSPRVGPAAASVTVVIFTDYQCTICKATDPALERLLASDADVRVIFKDWPVFGPVSRTAARAALAADRQGRYLAFHRGLMSARGRLDADQIRRIAIAAGVDWPRLVADEAEGSARLDAQLARHAMQAWSLGAEGTPAYLVGPYLLMGGLNDRRLAHAVREARRAGPPAP